jgi:hypothetical protein
MSKLQMNKKYWSFYLWKNDNDIYGENESLI